MNRRVIAFAVAVGALAVVTAACGGGSASSAGAGSATAGSPTGSAATQKDDGAGSVTVQATWVTPDHLAKDKNARNTAAEYEGKDVVLLHVMMDTHSVDLSKYDLRTLATLDAGQGAVQPLGLKDFSGSDSHHAEQVLVFQRPPPASTVTLTVREVGGVAERTLRWSPPPS